MTRFNLAQTGLQCRLWLIRFGWSKVLAVLLLACGIAAWWWALPHLKQRVAARQDAVLRTQKALANAPVVPKTPPIPLSEQHLQQFYDALGDSRYAEQQIKTLFAVAAKNGLTLSQAEYKFAYDRSGNFHTYSIILPIKGSYAAVRPFCEQVLLAIPFASLDDINFKRDAIANPALEAKLHFTLHLDGNGGAGSSRAVMEEQQESGAAP